MVGEFAGLASMAAAIALNARRDPHHALELLELGRGVIASLLLETRADISVLECQNFKLAEEFVSLRNQLDSPAGRLALPISDANSLSAELRAKRRRDVETRFHEVLREIRRDWPNFLRPPTEKELTAEAVLGPIILVNISHYRCDAFLVWRNGISVKRLREMTFKDVEKRVKDLKSDLTTILAWLWRVIAKPCLDDLGFVEPHPEGQKWRRVWWIPTGALVHFPLHAAGHHYNESKDTVLDRVMSSYSSSIKSLMYAREKRTQRAILGTPQPGTERVLLVGMKKTPGQAPLHYAGREVQIVKKFCEDWKLTPVTLSRNCRREVLNEIGTCKIFHFSGHGLSDLSEPSKSCLLLEDCITDPLTVAHLLDTWCVGNAPFLAYLSACSTGTINDQRLLDEAIHLINACQLAGFRNVVGMLWEVDDEYSAIVASDVYQALGSNLWKSEAVAKGLHNAVRNLRTQTQTVRTAEVYDRERAAQVVDNGEEEDDRRTESAKIDDRKLSGLGNAICKGGNPLMWAAYIHVGP